jgi:hypothetical protein
MCEACAGDSLLKRHVRAKNGRDRLAANAQRTVLADGAPDTHHFSIEHGPDFPAPGDCVSGQLYMLDDVGLFIFSTTLGWNIFDGNYLGGACPLKTDFTRRLNSFILDIDEDTETSTTWTSTVIDRGLYATGVDDAVWLETETIGGLWLDAEIINNAGSSKNFEIYLYSDTYTPSSTNRFKFTLPASTTVEGVFPIYWPSNVLVAMGDAGLCVKIVCTSSSPNFDVNFTSAKIWYTNLNYTEI